MITTPLHQFAASKKIDTNTAQKLLTEIGVQPEFEAKYGRGHLRVYDAAKLTDAESSFQAALDKHKAKFQTPIERLVVARAAKQKKATAKSTTKQAVLTFVSEVRKSCNKLVRSV